MAFFVAIKNSKSSWIEFSEAGVPFTLKCRCIVIAGNSSGESLNSGSIGCIFIIHKQKWRIGHWQDFVNGTGGFACVLLLYVRVTVKFWQEETFTWFLLRMCLYIIDPSWNMKIVVKHSSSHSSHLSAKRWLLAYWMSLNVLLFSQPQCKIQKDKNSFPTPGIEPGPRRWERRILTTRPRGKAWTCEEILKGLLLHMPENR